MYYSPYSDAYVAEAAATLISVAARGVPTWCIYDNTALGHALGNALTTVELTGRKVRSSAGPRLYDVVPMSGPRAVELSGH